MAATEFELEEEQLLDGRPEYERDPELTDPLPYGCIDVGGSCFSVGCAAPYKCVRRLLGGCECRPGKFCPDAPDPASGKCLRVLRRDGNYLVCCPKYSHLGDPCCRVHRIPSRLTPASEFEFPGGLESELEDALEMEPVFARAKGYFDEPYQWPTSRSFNPPPLQTIPAGPPRTFSPCQAIEDDFTKLVLAVDDLKNELRQRPPKLARVSNRADVVTALSRQIVAQLQKLSYVQRGCARQDMSLFASSVSVMRGPGADAATGSWPAASSSAVQGPRRQARESLRHLLNWIRRAERNFPKI